ncbi:MAG: leucine-rich repeat domain-containing protein, partial [Bacilli bacterium]|nr:leucine-rich repeat domain-containing protein [Bacilli bacterium]
EVGSNAFKNSGLTSVNLNNTVTVGGNAFERNGLSNLTIPSTITSIGGGAFRNNQFTGGVTWNAPISSVGQYYDGIFATSYVDSITFSTSLTKIPNNIFSDATLGFTEYTVPSHINEVGSNAFRNVKLTSVDLNNVEIIGGGAFYSNQLTSISFPYGVTSIGGDAFGRNQIGTVYIPNSTTYIGSYAFADNATLTSVTINNVEGAVSIGYNAFGGVNPYYSQ